MDDGHPLRQLLIVGLLTWGLAACGGAPAAAVAGEPDERLETGKACAPAETACEVGRCVAKLDNRCQTPVTCQLRIRSLCQTSAGEQGPAAATSKEVTVLSGDAQDLEAQLSCGQGTPVITEVDEVACM